MKGVRTNCGAAHPLEAQSGACRRLPRIFYMIQPLIIYFGGAGGIRTLDTAFQPYNGLANRRLQPLGHSSTNKIKYL